MLIAVSLRERLLALEAVERSEACDKVGPSAQSAPSGADALGIQIS
jgi:hypothetical protein